MRITVFVATAILSITYFAASCLLLYHHAAAAMRQEDTQNILGILALNEWGDFLAGITGPLALFWVIASVIIQGVELKEQRNEMAKQADALNAQSKFIEAELRRENGEQAWRDIIDLLEEFREQVPVPTENDTKSDPFITFQVEGEAIRFRYVPPQGVDISSLGLFQFLGRSMGGIKHASKKIFDAQSEGKKIGCPRSKAKFEKMLEILSFVNALKDEIPEHKKLILKGGRIDEWHNVMSALNATFDA